MKRILHYIANKRMAVFGCILLILFAVLFKRFYDLQIRNGEEYSQALRNQIEREATEPGTRGTIYDRNGKELAYNEKSYRVTIEDSEKYNNRTERNTALNRIISETIGLIEGSGDVVIRDIPVIRDEDGNYQYTVEGVRRQRFLADIFGYSQVGDLTYNRKLGYDEGTASAEQIIEYLYSEDMYGISSVFPEERALQIASVRYSLGGNSYQRYLSVDLARDISEETVAAVLENSSELPGVGIESGFVRRYTDSKYFAHILGYTGPVSSEELETLSAQGGDYTQTDIIGKAGIEQALEKELRGRNGWERFYVDNVGRVTEIVDSQEAAAGNHVYLTIDADLQKAVYDLLEEKLAGILVSNMVPSIEEGSGDLRIPIEDVYFALINNQVIDIKLFAEAGDGSAQQEIYAAFTQEQEARMSEMVTAMGLPGNVLDDQTQDIMSYILEMLQEAEYYFPAEVDRTGENYRRWTEEESSLEEFLRYGLESGAVHMGENEQTGQYTEAGELLQTLESWIMKTLPEEPGFQRLLYRFMLQNNRITGEQLCRTLFEQGILTDYGTEYEDLTNGNITAYSFIREQIRNIRITPAQLALDPSTASSVITDPNTGQVLACVTYPGYDNNRLANSVEAEYYSRLLEDRSLPLYNNATQQRTAPGSTFKPVTVTAALTENLITEDTVIEDHGIFEEITPSPRCWIFPAGVTHGAINVVEAIRDSCNYFFYMLGYSLSLDNGIYNETKGTDLLRTYAGMFGFDENSGIEITENLPQMADEFPVVAAIGQSNHNYTTTQLARYTAVLANKGSLYDLTLVDHVVDGVTGEEQKNEPELKRTLDAVESRSWDTIGTGMRMMAENNRVLGGLSVSVAGKTGTAQQTRNRPNHALFIGYAPYEQPEIAVATRIAYGYSSSNAVEVTADIFRYYFGLEPVEELITGRARPPQNSANTFAD